MALLDRRMRAEEERLADFEQQASLISQIFDVQQELAHRVWLLECTPLPRQYEQEGGDSPERHEHEQELFAFDEEAQQQDQKQELEQEQQDPVQEQDQQQRLLTHQIQ